MITAKVTLTQALKSQRQFIAETGSGHHIILADAAGATGAKPIELIAIAVACCTASEVPQPAALVAELLPASLAAVPAFCKVPPAFELDAPLPGTSPQCTPPAAKRKVVFSE